MASHLNADASTDRPEGGIQPAPSASGYVEAGGLRLHYLDYGTAGRPAMLCVHGGAAHAHWFDFVASGFSADYHVRALDWRGQGDSEWSQPPEYSYERFASDLAEVADKLDLRDFVLVGHSMGGMAALVYAATYPGRVGKLIVADTTLHMEEHRIAAMREVGARQGSNYATRDAFVARYRLRPEGTTAAPAIIRHVAEHAARQVGDGSWRHKFDRNIYLQRVSVDGLPYWNRIGIPALLVKGDRSPRITPQIFAAVKARCPHAGLAEVPHSDHHITLDNPSGFVQAVRAFLARGNSGV